MKKIITATISFLVILVAGILLYQFVFAPNQSNKDNPSTEMESSVTNNTQMDDTETIPAADFTVYAADGTAVNLSDFYGNPIVVNFWATWCPPCVSELPAFQDIYDEYGKDVHFLMVNMTDGTEETVEGVTKFIDENEYSFPVYYDTEMDAALTYYITSIPRTLFIDAEGNIFYGHAGMMDYSTLKEYMEQLVNQTK